MVTETEVVSLRLRQALAMLLAVLFHSTILSLACYAQDLQDPKKFYDSNFVNKPSEPSTPLPRATLPPKSKATITPRSVGALDPAVRITVTPSVQPTAIDDRSGSKIKSVSLIVSADPEHFEKHYLQLLALRDKYKLIVQDVFIIGDAQALYEQKNPSKIPGREIGGTFRYVKKVPAQFGDVKTSPTFAIETEQGTILMEGFVDIEKGFNSKGEFVEPSP